MSVLVLAKDEVLNENKEKLDFLKNQKDLTNLEEHDIGGHKLQILFNPLNPNYKTNSIDDTFSAYSGFGFYNGDPIDKVLDKIHANFNRGELKHEDLRGFYSFIFYKDNKFYLFADNTGMINFYYDNALKIFSTSLLVPAVIQTNLTFKQQEFYEFIHTGIIVDQSPIQEVVKNLRKDIIHYDGQKVEVETKKLDYQIPNGNDAVFEKLKEAMKEMILPFKNHNYKKSIGLSAGFDSRTVLTILDHLGLKPDEITHSFSDQGQSEIDIIEKMSKIVDSPVKYESTLKTYDESYITKHLFLTDGFPFNGSLLRPHVAKDWKERGENFDVYFKGHGGENLRSYYSYRKGPISIYDLNNLKFMVDTSGFKQMTKDKFLKNLEAKLSKFFGSGSMPVEMRERLYGEYFDSMVYVHNDNAQLTYYNLEEPFLDHKVLEHGFAMSYESKRFALLQRRLISFFSIKLAGVMSQYGVSYEKEFPFSYKFKKWVRFMTPAWMLPVLYETVFKPKKFQSIINNQETINKYKNKYNDYPEELLKVVNPDEVPNTRRLSRILTTAALLKELKGLGIKVSFSEKY